VLDPFRSSAVGIDPIVSYPAPPPTPTVVLRARCRKYLARHQGGSFVTHLGTGVLGGTPLPQAGPAAGSRSLRERLVSLSASLSRAASPRTRLISSRGRHDVSQRRSGPERLERRVLGSAASTLRLCSGVTPRSRPSSPTRHEHCSAPAAPHSNDVITDAATRGRRRRSRSWGRRWFRAAGWSRCMWAAGSGRRSRSDDREYSRVSYEPKATAGCEKQQAVAPPPRPARANMGRSPARWEGLRRPG
jgi:hypothetical protein